MMFFSNKAAGRAASAGRARGTGHVAICFFAQYPPSVEIQRSGSIPAASKGDKADDNAMTKSTSLYFWIN